MYKESKSKQEARFKWNRKFLELLGNPRSDAALWQSSDYYRIVEKLTPEQAAEKYKSLIEKEKQNG